ncbi:GLPGLI family protein [Weeksellaceae bacterium A-14]
MKKTIILFLLFIFNLHNCQYKIFYNIERKVNNRIFNADGVLQLNKKENKSIFYLSQYKNLIKKQYEIKENGDTIKVLHNNSICYDTKGYFYDFKNNNKTFLLYDVICESKVLISEDLTYPKWKIDNKPIKYKKSNVYRAFAKINDRNWTVLFSKDYKDVKNFGPWLFVGLPGLVIRAFDDKNNYSFELTKIEKNDNTQISKPKFSKIVSFEQYSTEAINANKKRMIKKISQQYNIPEKDVNLSDFPKYETLDFIEK